MSPVPAVPPRLADPGKLATVLGGPAGDGADGRVAVWAVEVVSALVRSYARLTITPEDDRSLVLRGTRSRVLVVGERPLRAVSAVTLDGTVLLPDQYRPARWGSVWREAGWVGPEVEVIVEADIGFEVVPPDLVAVVELAAARLTAFGQRDGEGDGDRPPPPFGFTVGELRTLDRYRRRTL